MSKRLDFFFQIDPEELNSQNVAALLNKLRDFIEKSKVENENVDDYFKILCNFIPNAFFHYKNAIDKFTLTDIKEAFIESLQKVFNDNNEYSAAIHFSIRNLNEPFNSTANEYIIKFLTNVEPAQIIAFFELINEESTGVIDDNVFKEVFLSRSLNEHVFFKQLIQYTSDNAKKEWIQLLIKNKKNERFISEIKKLPKIFPFKQDIINELIRNYSNETNLEVLAKIYHLIDEIYSVEIQLNYDPINDLFHQLLNNNNSTDRIEAINLLNELRFIDNLNKEVICKLVLNSISDSIPENIQKFQELLLYFKGQNKLLNEFYETNFNEIIKIVVNTTDSEFVTSIFPILNFKNQKSILRNVFNLITKTISPPDQKPATDYIEFLENLKNLISSKNYWYLRSPHYLLMQQLLISTRNQEVHITAIKMLKAGLLNNVVYKKDTLKLIENLKKWSDVNPKVKDLIISFNKSKGQKNRKRKKRLRRFLDVN